MRPDPSGQIANYLASNQNFIIADLWSFSTVYGELLRYSGYTVPITVPASYFDTFSINANNSGSVAFPLGPRFGRSAVKTKIGLSVDTLKLDIYAGQSDTLGMYTWQQAFFHLLFDGATVELGRVVCAPRAGSGIDHVVGYVVWFQGIVGDVEVGRTAINVTVNSSLVLLTTQYPRRLWQATCSHVFGDAMCQFDRQSLAATVQSTTSLPGGGQQITTTFTPNPYNLFDLGTIVAIGGANGPTATRPHPIKRTISVVRDGIIYCTVPWIYPIAAGDYFSLLPGCDHTLNSCQNLFNNLQHFGGQPYIPQEEFSV